MKCKWLSVFCVLVIAVMSMGIDKCQINTNTATLTAIELGGYNLGYYIGKSKTDADDIAIADAYKLAREGQLSPEEVAKAFAKLKIENPQLSGSLLIVLKSMGADFGVDGGLISLSNIPVEYWDKAAEGYVVGYEFGKAGQKSVKPSAVKAVMPNK